MSKESVDYWKKVLFQDREKKPTTASAVRKLKKPFAEYFSEIREEVLRLGEVKENIRHMGPTWKWTWTYEFNHEKLLFLHPSSEGISATFIVSYNEESKILNAPHISADIKQSIRKGRNARNVRWVWLDLKTDQRVSDLLTTIHFKYQLLTTMEQQEQQGINGANSDSKGIVGKPDSKSPGSNSKEGKGSGEA